MTSENRLAHTGPAQAALEEASELPLSHGGREGSGNLRGKRGGKINEQIHSDICVQNICVHNKAIAFEYLKVFHKLVY